MRLIDADALMKDIIRRFGCKPYIEVGNKCEYIHKIINDQPTAYDVDKVVEQADEILYNRCYDTDYKLGTKEMEEVIRKGGKE